MVLIPEYALSLRETGSLAKLSRTAPSRGPPNSMSATVDWAKSEQTEAVRPLAAGLALSLINCCFSAYVQHAQKKAQPVLTPDIPLRALISASLYSGGTSVYA